MKMLHDASLIVMKSHSLSNLPLSLTDSRSSFHRMEGSQSSVPRLVLTTMELHNRDQSGSEGVEILNLPWQRGNYFGKTITSTIA